MAANTPKPKATKPISAAETLIELTELTVNFGRQPVLRDISLSIPRGQTIAIIGESGCGKTVLLKHIIGLLFPSSGYVAFDGQRIDSLNDKELTALRGRFGFLFQNAALFDSMTVADNIAFPLKENSGMRGEKIDQIVALRLKQVGLPNTVLGKRPAQLSGGMRKRVGLARALVMSPEVLLYDEPTTGLDPIVSDVINELIMRTRDQNSVTSIVVTHDMKTAQKVADRVVMLYPLPRLKSNESQIIFDGTPAEIVESRDKRVSQFVRGEAGERLLEMEQAVN
ncbi:MAG TPA: ABC transporter ATP-binding protein [Lacipirellulaceae bacterium]|jgi:phospholipid/cholesterol/gamma-HCH transport system ATP-binding protein|nr:ABC transporter ATP-binding protein [Lacipirellulaceae bacterium]